MTQTTKHAGRPPKAEEDRRSETIKVLVTKDQRAQLEAAAEKENRSLSDYVRIAALRASEQALIPK